MASDTSAVPTAYSYLRFSSPAQATGDSIRRQEALRDAWLKKTGVVFNPSLTMTDAGVSAFAGEHRGNPDRFALAAFLEQVKRGDIAKGSYLIVENLDRLSREDIVPAVNLFTGILLSGVRIVQLIPNEQVFNAKADMMQVMLAIMEMSRGNAESKLKSERVGQKWAERKKAASTGAIVTARCPAWLQIVEGKFAFKPGALETIRRMFEMSRSGLGTRSIAQVLNTEAVPHFAPAAGEGKWDDMYVRKILTCRAVLGEYQPFTRKRQETGQSDSDSGRAVTGEYKPSTGRPKPKPDGPVVENYYPKCVTEEQWFASAAAMKARLRKGSRPAKDYINPFATLLKDARTGGPMAVSLRANKGGPGHYRVLLPQWNRRGFGDKCVSFPYLEFERAILSKLKEIDPREILPRETGRDEVMSLSGRLIDLDTRIGRIKAKLTGTDDNLEALIDVLRDLDSQRKTVADALANAKQAAASPAAEAWGEALTLADVIFADPSDAPRIRLRGAMQRIISGIWILLVARGQTRLAAVQVWFKGDTKQRSYFLVHRAARVVKRGEPSRPANCKARTASMPTGFDMREAVWVKQVETVLQKIPVDQD